MFMYYRFRDVFFNYMVIFLFCVIFFLDEFEKLLCIKKYIYNKC